MSRMEQLIYGGGAAAGCAVIFCVIGKFFKFPITQKSAPLRKHTRTKMKWLFTQPRSAREFHKVKLFVLMATRRMNVVPLQTLKNKVKSYVAALKMITIQVGNI